MFLWCGWCVFLRAACWKRNHDCTPPQGNGGGWGWGLPRKTRNGTEIGDLDPRDGLEVYSARRACTVLKPRAPPWVPSSRKSHQALIGRYIVHVVDVPISFIRWVCRRIPKRPAQAPWFPCLAYRAIGLPRRGLCVRQECPPPFGSSSRATIPFSRARSPKGWQRPSSSSARRAYTVLKPRAPPWVPRSPKSHQALKGRYSVHVVDVPIFPRSQALLGNAVPEALLRFLPCFGRVASVLTLRGNAQSGNPSFSFAPNFAATRPLKLCPRLVALRPAFGRCVYAPRVRSDKLQKPIHNLGREITPISPGYD